MQSTGVMLRIMGAGLVLVKFTSSVLFIQTHRQKLFYRLHVLLKQDNAELWVTAFSDIAETIMGMSTDQFNALDKRGQMKAVDRVVGLKLLVDIGKSMRNGYTNYVLNQIFPARTTFSDDIIDQV